MLGSRLYSAALVGPLLNLGSLGVAQEAAPCDTSTQACLNVMMANACLAAYIRGGNATEIFRCVNVDDQAVAQDEVSSVLLQTQTCATLSLTKASFVHAMDAPSLSFGSGSPAVTYASEGRLSV